MKEKFKAEKSNSGLIAQDNHFIRNIKYGNLSLTDIKVFKAIISKIDHKASMFDEFYILDYEDLDLVGVNDKHRFREVTRSLKNLSSHFVKIKNREGDDVELGLISNRFVYKRHSTKILIEIHDDLKPYLLNLKNRYSLYPPEMLKKITTTNALMLYENLKAWENRGQFTITVENLKELLEIKPDKYKVYGNFKCMVLTKSLDIINQYTDISVDMREIKEGKKVTSLVFDITKKENNLNYITEHNLVKLLHEVFADLNGNKFVITSYEKNPDSNIEYRFKTLSLTDTKEEVWIPSKGYMDKIKLYKIVSDMIERTKKLKRGEL